MQRILVREMNGFLPPLSTLLNKSDMKLSQGSFYFEEGRNRREEAQMGETENLPRIPGLPSGLNPLLMGLCSG